jgi:hypothetical protein
MAKPLKEPNIRRELGFDETMRRALMVQPEAKPKKKPSAKRKK